MSVSLSDFDINNHEFIPTQLFNTAIEGSMYVANSIAELIDSRNKESKPTVLGLATGSTPTQVYDELVRKHKEEGLSFERVITFNLDEYYPMSPDAHQSYNHFMHEYLFKHINLSLIHI